MYRILIVEDDDKIAGILQEYLEKYGYEAVRTTDYKHIKDAFLQHKPELVLLDINLPSYDGFYWCRQIRTVSSVPILFMSARVGEMDQILAIENGGDDYITKPFHSEVVMAKIKSALRRAYGEYAQVQTGRELTELNGLFVDRTRNSAEWQGRRVDLSRNELLLLDLLLKQAGEVVSRERLLEALWDDIDFVDDNTLTVNVTRVRKKLEELGITHAIETVRGQGYRLQSSWEGEG
ncbi:response regulator transcription factor [Paenibacillus elgii]|uniref:response regulator transcription factor n=1 Tax=Paenibacillus elgii TaxID=189691 RepID=UPI002041AD69|nr:response regulator transcription factor [Paenibacillus elgii]MCM3271356.1 response regulator transcription factor [Paenibacillus elgii]